MKSAGCCSDEKIPPPPNGGSPPFSREAIINASLQTPYQTKLTACTSSTSKSQHYRYRQGQQSALASPRRTARYERIPPDGFDTAALEVTLCGETPPPASLVPLPFQGRLICKLANAVKNKVHRLHRKTPEYQHYRYRQGQQSALASPRRTARYERIPPNGFDTAALEVTLCGETPPPPNGGSPLPCGHLPNPVESRPFQGRLMQTHSK